MAIEITLEPVDLEKQKVLVPQAYQLYLHENIYEMHLMFLASEPQKDDGLPWEEVQNDFIFRFRKDKFAGMERFYCQDGDYWKITVWFDGIGGHNLFFPTQAKCEEVFGQLDQYFFT
jgi:hypothetical protein